ncbi:MAG: BatA domain-containing protein [Bacteroidales bacterium]|nr:BatA domain-containing protein [Bacteroidales bacterium]
MNFLYPNILWCLFALAIPIIIHLFNFRRHKIVYFSNTATLKTIKQENAKTKKLKYIIALIMRMLFIAALVLAFAYPYNPDQTLKTDDADNLVAVYIDNSMSMQSQSSEISLIEDARASARKMVSNISPSQRFVLLTNSRQPDNEYPMNQDEMLMSIDAMQTEASPMSINALYENLQMIMRRNGFKSASLFMYSDFQDNVMNLNGIVADSAIQIVAMPLKSDYQQNIYIDTVWLSSPILQKDLANEINVRVVNESGKDVKGLPVNFEIDGKAVAFNTIDVPANGRNDVSMQFIINDGKDAVCHVRSATVSINDFPITFNDTYNFILNVRPIIKIVELSTAVETHGRASQQSQSPLATLFSNDSLFNYTRIDPRRIDQQYLSDCQLIIIDGDIVNETMMQSILNLAKDDCSVVLLPSDADPKIFDDTLSISTIASQHEFFDDIFVSIPENADLPKVYKHVQIDNKRFYNSLSLISLQNGTSFFTLSQIGSGNVFVFASKLDKDWTDFTDNSLFVPIMYKIAMLGGKINRLSYTIGVDKELLINDLSVFSEGDVRIRDMENTFEMIPIVELRNNRALIRLYDELPSAGFYTINKGDEVIETTAWNDSRKESKMKFLDGEEVDKILKNKGLNVLAVMRADEFHSNDVMKMMVRRSMLWKSFIILSLITMLIEILVLRFWK